MSVLILIALILGAGIAAFLLLPLNDAASSRNRAAVRAAELESIGSRVQVRSGMYLQAALRTAESDSDLAAIRDGPSWERLIAGLDLRNGMRPELRIDGQGSLIFRMGDVDTQTCSMVNLIRRSDRRGCYQEGDARFYFVVLNRLSDRLSDDAYDDFDLPTRDQPPTRLRTQQGVPSAMR